MKTTLVVIAACVPITACLTGFWVLAAKHRRQADSVPLTKAERAALRRMALGSWRTARWWRRPPKTS